MYYKEYSLGENFTLVRSVETPIEKVEELFCVFLFL